MAPLTAGIDIAIGACDRAAFQAAKNRVLEAIGRLLTQSPNDPWLLAERGRIEETQFPRPCPPEATGAPGSQTIRNPPVTYGVQDRLTPGVAHDGGNAMWTPRTTLGFGVGYGESTLPRANYGVISDGTVGSDRPAGYSERAVPTFNFSASVRSRRFELLLGYRQGDASNRTVVAPGTGAFQGVVGTDNALSGSTGVAADLGVAVDTVTSFDEFFGRARFNVYGFGDDWAWARAQSRPSVFPPSAGIEAPIRVPRRESRLSGRVTAELFALHRDSDYLGTASIVGTTGAGTPVSVVQSLDQEVRQVEVGVNVGVEATIPLSAGVRLTVGAQVGGYYFDYDGTSVEDRVQNVGPTADRAYKITLEGNESGIAYRGDAIAELTVDLSEPFQLFAGASASYNDVRGYWVNPSSGDFVLNGGRSFVDTGHAVDWQLTAGVRFAFGQPPQR